MSKLLTVVCSDERMPSKHGKRLFSVQEAFADGSRISNCVVSSEAISSIAFSGEKWGNLHVHVKKIPWCKNLASLLRANYLRDDCGQSALYPVVKGPWQAHGTC